MKYALVEGQRREAQADLSGECIGCGQPMMAKCGDVRAHHWSHRGKRMCDPWWENETEWHRAWKNHFPSEWQEIPHRAEGETHFADVKTAFGWALEFQHSAICPQERASRDAYYKKIVWIVDGTRRKRDKPQFTKIWSNGSPVNGLPSFRKVFFPDECTLLREWASSPSPIFFDFGEDAPLFWLLPHSPDGKREFVAAFSRTDFINLHREDANEAQNFESFLKEFAGLMSPRTQQIQTRSLEQEALRQRQRQYLAPRNMSRFRTRL